MCRNNYININWTSIWSWWDWSMLFLDNIPMLLAGGSLILPVLGGRTKCRERNVLQNMRLHPQPLIRFVHGNGLKKWCKKDLNAEASTFLQTKVGDDNLKYNLKFNRAISKQNFTRIDGFILSKIWRRMPITIIPR